MFHQKDYILRIIEQMALIVAEIRRRLAGGRAVNLADELRTMSSYAGLDLTLAGVLDGEAILTLLSPAGEPDPARVWLAGEMLYLQGLAERSAGDLDAAELAWRKALFLYGVVGSIGLADVKADLAERVAEVGRLLKDLDAPGPSAA